MDQARLSREEMGGNGSHLMWIIVVNLLLIHSLLYGNDHPWWLIYLVGFTAGWFIYPVLAQKLAQTWKDVNDKINEWANV